MNITKNTVAIFITHAQGFNGLSDKLLSYLKKNNILLIEDVCESHGAKHNKKKNGCFGWVSNFSFYYAHHLSTIEGGMVCTNDYETYQQLKIFRGHGMLRESDDHELKKYYYSKYQDLNKDFIFLYNAFNVRNTEIGGLLGTAQLSRLNSDIIKRTKNFKLFLSLLDKIFTNFKVEGSSIMHLI